MPAEEKSVSTGVGFRTQYVEVSPNVFAPVVVVKSALDAGTGSSAVTVADGANVTFGKKDDAAAAADGTAASYMSLFRRLLGKFPISIGPKTAAGALAVTLATDDAAIGTKVTAVPALASGGTGLIGWLSAQWQALINLGNQFPATIGPKTNALSLSVTPATDANLARETYTTVTATSVPTLAAGANFNAFAALACTSLDLINPNTVDIEYRRGGAGVAIPVPAGTSRLVQGLTNANQIGIRRVDQAAGVVTAYAEGYAV